jgi:Holliday junction resolvase-like predicted endonuclease
LAAAPTRSPGSNAGGLSKSAEDYLARHHRGGCRCRFDVVSIEFTGGAPVFELYQNAFDA